MKTLPPWATFSIVACDLERQEWGVAVASKFLAVGMAVPWAAAGVGAIATQSWANTTYGPRGLRLLRRGLTAQQALDRLIAQDSGRAQRQAGIVDAAGRSATYTGEKCFPWAGGRAGPGYACQGNILVSGATVDAMVETFLAAKGDLAARLLATLQAGDQAGGDSRGKESAALLVVKPKGGYAGFNDRYVDLRVDDHPNPVPELARLLKLHRLYLGKTDPADLRPVTPEIAREIQATLQRLGRYPGPVTGDYDEATKTAWRSYMLNENLDDRVRDDDQVDQVALDYLRGQYRE